MKPAPGVTRRDFIRLATAVGAGITVGLTRLFDRSAAWATDLTPSTVQSTKCYKCSGFASGTKCALCGSSVSSVYCGPDNWHDNHTRQTGTCSWRYHKLRLSSCDGKNAWKWLTSTWGGSQSWRCSDGQARHSYPCSGYEGSWFDTVCPAAI